MYFANKEARETTAILLNKAKMWTDNIENTGYKYKLIQTLKAYHGDFFSDYTAGHQINFTGEQGELVQIPINHLRNLAQHMLIMTTSNRPAMEARAINTDYKSLVQTTLANGILEYYMREKRLEKYLKNAVELCIATGAGYVKMDWNATTGEIIDYIDGDPEAPIYEGDVEFSNVSAFDVVFDGSKEHQDHDWVLVRSWKNKYDYAAKYPEYAEKIKSLRTKSEIEQYRTTFKTTLDETDDIAVYEFYHKKTTSMPSGRYILFLDEDIILQDLPMPYRVLPLFRIAPSEILGTPHGYTPLFDLLPIQEAINSLYSTILTNQNAFGVQNIWVKPGSNINVGSISGGLNIIESMDKPEPIQLTNTPKEIFEFIKMLEAVMEVISGVNSVARGHATDLGSNPSGTALALIQSMALQFMSGLQQGYVQLIEDVGTALIKLLQDFAESPRLIAIAGRNNRTYMKTFKSEDIDKVSRVVVDVGNPLSKSTAGRVQMADQLLQYQLIKNPQQYISIINTGRLDVLTEDTQHELFLIKSENEHMIDGEIPPVTMIDDHQTHILEHRSILADPDLRKDPELVSRALAHISEHIRLLREGDPQLLTLIGQQPLQPQQPQQPEQQGITQQAVQQGAIDEIVQPPLEGQAGIAQEGGQVSGPGIESGANIPQPPKVNPELLPNPQLQG